MNEPNIIMMVAVVIGILLLLLLSGWIIKKIVAPTLELPMDEMDGAEFEKFCAGLLEEKGFQEVTLTKASGDFGVDILAEKEGITYAIQCKRYAEPVGVKAIQEVYAGKEYYDCMVGAVLTNQYFTAPAVEAAKKLKILLWDRGYLESMLGEN